MCFDCFATGKRSGSNGESVLKMPKTPKNGKKTGDNTTKKESTGLADKTRSDDALSECGKEFYRAQIRDLEEQLEK